MNEQKSLLEIFTVTKKEFEKYYYIVQGGCKIIDVSEFTNPQNYVPDFRGARYVPVYKEFDEEKADLLSMHYHFRLSLISRKKDSEGKSKWQAVRHHEQCFLEIVNSAPRVPPEVLAIAHVVADYWLYLDQLGTD